MALRVLCTCGKSQIYPDSYRGKTVPCRKCRVPLVVTGEKVEPPKVSWTRRVLPFALVLIIPITVGVVIYRSRQPRFTHAADEYREGSKAPIDPKVDGPRIERLLAALAAASRDGNQTGFIGCFHVRRMLAEIELKGVQQAIGMKREESSLEDEVQSVLGGLCAQMKTSFSPWESVKRCTVKYLEGRGEAEVFVVFKKANEVDRLRFWLIKEQDAWGIFDYESLETGFRFSSDNARLLLRQRRGDLTPGTVERTLSLLEKAENLLVRDKCDDALDALSQAELGCSLHLLAGVEQLQAAVLFRLGRGEEALAKIDSALRRRSGVPAGVQLRGFILHSLERYEEAIRAQQDYLKAVGEDAIAYLWIGMAYESLKRPEQALDAYRKGLASDEEHAELREKVKALEGVKK